MTATQLALTREERDQEAQYHCLSYLGLIQELHDKSAKALDWLIRNISNTARKADYDITKEKYNALELDIYRAEFWMHFVEAMQKEVWLDYIVLVPRNKGESATAIGYEIDIAMQHESMMLPSEYALQMLYKILAKYGAQEYGISNVSVTDIETGEEIAL